MEECEFCGEEFEGENELHRHWDEHRDEINSHQEEKMKKAQRKHKEQMEQKTSKRKTYAGYGLAAVVFLGLLGIVGAQLIGSSGGNNAVQDVNIEGEPVAGNESAEVTIVEYGDFQCPACAEFDSRIYSRIKEDYIDTGQAKFVWKDFPLSSVHPWANEAARTMECVQRQDQEAFWNVKKTLFANQEAINQTNVRSQIISWAEDEGVEGEQIRQCISQGDPNSEVEQDRAEGESNGVRGTPTVFINGEKADFRNYESLQSIIESELNENN